MEDQEPTPKMLDASAPIVSAPKPLTRSIGSTGSHCIQHPQISTSRRCDRCRDAMCELCHFEFPGNLHVCPKCVAAPTVSISGKRMAYAIAGLVVSALSIAVLGLFMSGFFAESSEGMLNMIFLGLITLPAAVGLAVSYSAMDRNLGNSTLLWIASVVSSVELAAVFGLIIYGNLNS